MKLKNIPTAASGDRTKLERYLKDEQANDVDIEGEELNSQSQQLQHPKYYY